jgi:DNA ligase D
MKRHRIPGSRAGVESLDKRNPAWVEARQHGAGQRRHWAARRRQTWQPLLMATDAELIEVNGRAVTVSHPDKVFFADRGETKLDLVKFYLSIGDPFLLAMRGRPTMLQRFPDGADGKSFYQKRVPAGTPEWIQTTEVMTPNGTPSNALVLADLAHVIWAINLGCLGFHPWPYMAATPETTDELRIDLDPTPGVSFDDVRRAALLTKEVLDEIGIAAYPKTTGNRGIHIYVRVRDGYDGYAVRFAAVALARELERRHPTVMTAAWWKEERGQRVFVDFNQNAPHKTVFGPWCVRSRSGAQVSTPLSWDELADVQPDDVTIATVPALVARRGNPWEHMNGAPQSLEPLMEWHRRDRANGMLDAPWPPVYPKQPDEPPRVAPSRAKK